MIIGVTGYGATGASAYIDLIKEYYAVQSFDAAVEFQVIQETDGISDLKYHLVLNGHRLRSNAAICRFEKNLKNPRICNLVKYSNGLYKKLAIEYIHNLTQLSWNGRSSFDPIDFRPKIDRLKTRKLVRVINGILSRLNDNWGVPPLQKRYLSFLTEKEFCNCTREFLNKFFRACGFDMNKPILVEQIFNTRNPLEGTEYFEDFRSLVVERDPRDVFILTNYVLRRHCGFMPHDGDVNKFVRYYKLAHGNRIDHPNVKYVQYEDLIFDYENVCNTIGNWLGLAHEFPKKYFKPEHSYSNTQIYLSHPECSEQIKYIEENLAEYLYPFEQVKSSLTFEPIKGKPFNIEKK